MQPRNFLEFMVHFPLAQVYAQGQEIDLKQKVSYVLHQLSHHDLAFTYVQGFDWWVTCALVAENDSDQEAYQRVKALTLRTSNIIISIADIFNKFCFCLFFFFADTRTWVMSSNQGRTAWGASYPRAQILFTHCCRYSNHSMLDLIYNFDWATNHSH